MEIQLTPSYILTTEHSQSSFGQPVLYNQGTRDAYGPYDVLQPYPSWGFMTGRQAVLRMADVREKDLEQEQVEMINRFVQK